MPLDAELPGPAPDGASRRLRAFDRLDDSVGREGNGAMSWPQTSDGLMMEAVDGLRRYAEHAREQAIRFDLDRVVPIHRQTMVPGLGALARQMGVEAPPPARAISCMP